MAQLPDPEQQALELQPSVAVLIERKGHLVAEAGLRQEYGRWNRLRDAGGGPGQLRHSDRAARLGHQQVARPGLHGAGDRARRRLPSARAALLRASSAGAPRFSSCSTITFSDSGASWMRAQRERTVARSASGCSLTRRKVVAGGGSSSVLSSVFWARSFMASAGVTPATLRRPRAATNASRRESARTSSTRISLDGGPSTSARERSPRAT